MRGLRLVGGGNDSYPLQDSIYARGFGAGVRRRSAAAVLQTHGHDVLGSGGVPVMSEIAIAATAYADRYEAAVRFAKQAWPFNWHVLNDPKLEAAMRETLHGPREWSWGELGDIQLGAGYLLVPANGSRTDVLPGVDVEALVRASVPNPMTACDRCDRTAPRFGWLVVAAPPHLLALSICDDCAVDLNKNYPPIHWIF